jgi:iron complex outermembrane recepter protein
MKNRLWSGAIPALAILVLGPALAAAQAPGAIRGSVLAPDGTPAADAVVRIVGLNRSARSSSDGAFAFESVPPGEHLLEARSRRFGTSVQSVLVAAGETVRLELRLDVSVHEELVVTASPDGRQASDVAQPVQVLTGQELSAQLQPTLGETLAEQPGVHASYFGPGSSRPVIRGLGGDRIRILENGLGAGDASSTSPDHAVSVDPLSAERIEILRGPATLLYGSSAIGGVVNVMDRRVPPSLPDRPLAGTVQLHGASAARELSGALALDGRLGGKLAWHASALKRDTGDYRIPGFAEARHEDDDDEADEGERGRLENSSIRSQGLGLGVSYVAESGFFGAAVSGYDTNYGIPGQGHGDDDGDDREEEERVRVDLKQRRLDLRGQLNRLGPFRGAQLRLGVMDYEHVELEGSEIGTVFRNDSWEARLELPHRRIGPLRGTIGVQASSRDFEAIGEEAFVPPTGTRSYGLFALEELGTGPLRLQLGGRYESQRSSAEGGPDRSFDGFSASVGVVWRPAEAWSLAASGSRSLKLPNAEELYSNGPHLATRSFEIGNPDLGNEISLGLDLSLRRRTGPVTGEVNLFVNRFDGFIYPELTGGEQAGLQVVRYVQRDARFMGAELHLDVTLLHTEPHHVDLELQADLVRAELTDSGEPLPRISPARLGAAVVYRGSPWSARMGVRRVFEQDRVADFEEPTEGYTMLDASVGYQFLAGGVLHEVQLRGTNLLDQEARSHVSFLKELAPLPGRSFGVAYTLMF